MLGGMGVLSQRRGTTANRYLYTGQQFDALTGQYSLRARYYKPGDGRFLSRDVYPYNFQNPMELNRYGYVANNPIMRFDPTGLVEYALTTSARGTSTSIFTTKLGQDVFWGGVAGLVGYYLGTFAAAAMITLFEGGDLTETFSRVFSEFELVLAILTGVFLNAVNNTFYKADEQLNAVRNTAMNHPIAFQRARGSVAFQTLRIQSAAVASSIGSVYAGLFGQFDVVRDAGIEEHDLSDFLSSTGDNIITSVLTGIANGVLLFGFDEIAGLAPRNLGLVRIPADVFPSITLNALVTGLAKSGAY